MRLHPIGTPAEFSKTEQTYLRLIGENLYERRQQQKSNTLKKFQTVLPDYHYASELLWFTRFLPEILVFSPDLLSSLNEDVEKVLQEPNLFTLEYIAGIFPFIIALTMNNYLTDAVEGSMAEWCLDYFSVKNDAQRTIFQNRIVWLEKQLHYTETVPIIKTALSTEITGKYLSFAGITSAFSQLSANEIERLAALEYGSGSDGKEVGQKITNGFTNEYLTALHSAMITMISEAVKMSKLGALESQTELIDTSSLHIILQQRIEESLLAKSEIFVLEK